MKSILFSIISIASIISTIQAAPADLKTDDLDTNEIPLNKNLPQKEVQASWGGFQASAGLGGDSGLYASAGTPNGPNANAGLSGVSSAVDTKSAASGDSTVYYGTGTPNSNGGGPLDRVFAIPINVLHSVNNYLKTTGASKGVYGVQSAPNGDSGANVRINVADENNTSSSSSSASASGSVDSSAGGPYYGIRGQHRQPDYDRIFNIPITALKSVSDLLGGR